MSRYSTSFSKERGKKFKFECNQCVRYPCDHAWIPNLICLVLIPVHCCPEMTKTARKCRDESVIVEQSFINDYCSCSVLGRCVLYDGDALNVVLYASTFLLNLEIDASHDFNEILFIGRSMFLLALASLFSERDVIIVPQIFILMCEVNMVSLRGSHGYS